MRGKIPKTVLIIFSLSLMLIVSEVAWGAAPIQRVACAAIDDPNVGYVDLYDCYVRQASLPHPSVWERKVAGIVLTRVPEEGSVKVGDVVTIEATLCGLLRPRMPHERDSACSEAGFNRRALNVIQTIDNEGPER